ncbi:CS6 fimbrial subunit B [Escherichia coli TA054]|uniref:CS6 fimbrial subunit B n=1 Tax=Escherichia coli TaxID=562 RepID=UPI000A187114|nr:CS6 fimbrial subunit B [Escherichia coli]OSL66232.1 CS6 fimbrial subunit B [Escherichia coli TA054]
MKTKLLPVAALLLSLSPLSHAGEWTYSPLDVSIDIKQKFVPDIDSAVTIIPITHESDPKIDDPLYTVNITIPEGVGKLKIVPADGVMESSKMIGTMINQDAPEQVMKYYMKSTGGDTIGGITPGRPGLISVKENQQYQFSAIYNGGSSVSGYAAGNYNGNLTVAFYSN